MLIFSLPEMVDVIDRKFHDLSEEQRMHVYDISSGVYNAILGFGQVIGPIYATAVTSSRGFSTCCDYAAIGSLGLGIAYLIFTRAYRPGSSPRTTPL